MTKMSFKNDINRKDLILSNIYNINRIKTMKKYIHKLCKIDHRFVELSNKI